MYFGGSCMFYFWLAFFFQFFRGIYFRVIIDFYRLFRRGGRGGVGRDFVLQFLVMGRK